MASATARGGGLEALRPLDTRIERILQRSILSFWFPRCLDRKNGGYITDLDARGEARPGGPKTIVNQARTLWLASHAVRAGYASGELLDAAAWGVRFMREKMWDPAHGGFFWQVDATGAIKQRRSKHTFGQVAGLYALSEYSLATGDLQSLAQAKTLFDLLEAKAHDPQYGGYREVLGDDWGPSPPDERPAIGGDAGSKFMNTHLHFLEALATFYRASKLPLARERLLEVIGIESNAVVRKGARGCTDEHERDWTPRLVGDQARDSYGHDLENAWLLEDACTAADVPAWPLVDLFRSLADNALALGWDTGRGGFFESGLLGRPADRLNKVWWAQAEALVGLMHLYRRTGDPAYRTSIEKTLDFIERVQIDRRSGGWTATVTPGGTSDGAMGDLWKDGYHEGRAMMECLDLLRGRHPR